MADKLTHLRPSHMWKYFEEICKIPHESKNEKQIGEYLMETAKKGGFSARQDKAGNVVIEVPASPGYENARTVVLQGHMDMVCEKNSDTVHDFTKDPIKPVIEGEWLTAEGTTLGADNGIGMAAGLAFLEDKENPHGPLELLFTVDEETGLNGAMALESDFVKGRIMLNLDSEEEGAFSIGCAGGGDSQITLPVKRQEKINGNVYQIKLSGLKGGHSGLDIGAGKGNAAQLLARILYLVKTPFDLISLEGGTKHNAIPREAFAQISVKENDMDAFRKNINENFEQVRFEYKAVEKASAIALAPYDKAEMLPMTDASKEKFLSLVVAAPHGVQAMSQEIEGLVETSTNLAIVRTENDQATVYSSTRSSILSALEATRSKIEACAKLTDASFENFTGYPAWTPNLESPLLGVMKNTYKELYGKEPHIEAIHAGLECGIIGDKYPGMDMISFGPDLRNPHSPDEKVHIESVGRFWDLLAATLKKLAE